ncbi:hypothetical protein R69776_04350 [Paraburkholderia nemoris]|uniref:Uncharacterized protein n=2 Tax=Paraburkholderia nemoris TaxID=2793076 RepID=A0ABN7M2K9_9BURK|nr:hypothetical protein R75777_03655 [Paraburkholderia nemoris]CAE6781859.1 hypothetical protein R69776_04350 [Paraburkholderia nemoris]
MQIQAAHTLEQRNIGMTSKRNKSRLAGELNRFVQQYARKTLASEPNDRQYDRKLEKKMKQLSPSELSELLSEDEQASDQAEPDND